MKALLRGSLSAELFLAAFLGLCCTAAPSFSASYDDQRSSAVKTCQAIDPAEYQSGLVFNPDGYRSYYVRSECFQRIAVRFRDETLCRQVKQRRSLFSSSWGYSSGRCRELVAEGGATDRKSLEEIKQKYLAGAVRLRDFRVERNGNGRDFDIIPAFSGAYAHGHTLRFEIIHSGATGPEILLHSSGYYVDGNSNLRIFLRQDEIRKRFPDFTLNRLYLVRATIILDVGNGGLAGLWSDGFIDRVFPVHERSQSLEKDVRF
jgi:hypothetical protein